MRFITIILILALVTFNAYGGISFGSQDDGWWSENGDMRNIPPNFDSTNDAISWAREHEDIRWIPLLQLRRNEWENKANTLLDQYADEDYSMYCATQAQFFRECLEEIERVGSVVRCRSEIIKDK